MEKELTRFEKEFGLTVNEEGKIVVGSRVVAEKYGKRHDNVLVKIDGFVEAVPELGVLNFKEAQYTDEQNGQIYREYIMDRQGFSILVNKFTGKEALLFTIKYTQAFEDMSEQLKQIDNVIKVKGNMSLDDYNKIRFSSKRTINSFADSNEDDVKKLVKEFIQYAGTLDTETRVIRCQSAIKGLERLQAKLGMDSFNVGDCYKIRLYIEKIMKIQHEAENRRNGQLKCHKDKKIRQLVSKLEQNVDGIKK